MDIEGCCLRELLEALIQEEVMHTGYTKNEFGTPVSTHVCDTCGEEFTVCPPGKANEGWKNCMGVNCPSYDKSRDMDLLFNDPERRKKIKRCSIQKGPKPKDVLL